MIRKLLLAIVAIVSIATASAQERATPDSAKQKKLLFYAHRLKFGINTDVNLERAAKVYYYLVKQGNTDAMRELGRMYINGEGVKTNHKAAWQLLKKAIASGNDKAMCDMALMYQKGIGVKPNFRNAFRLYRAAANRGNARGYYGVGYMLYKGMGVKQNYAKAEEFLLKGSEKGSAQCDFLLGSYYAYGFGGQPDYDKAKLYLNKAVQNGHGWTIDMTLKSILDSIIASNTQNAARMAKAKTRAFGVRVPDVRYKVYSTDSVIGTWVGTVRTYDWSKTRVLKEQPVRFEVEALDTNIIIRWLNNDSLYSVFQSDKRVGNKWMKKVLRHDEKVYKWIPTSATLELSKDANTLYADFRRAKTSNSDPIKPMSATLTRVGGTTAIRAVKLIDGISISPLPIGDSFTISVHATENVVVVIAIYTVDGIKVVDGGKHALTVGNNQINVNSILPRGQYIVRIEGNGVNESRNITHL